MKTELREETQLDVLLARAQYHAKEAAEALQKAINESDSAQRLGSVIGLRNNALYFERKINALIAERGPVEEL